MLSWDFILEFAIYGENIVKKLVCFILILGCAAPANAGDAEKGKALYAVCTACHGEDGGGKKELAAPRLAGQEDWYLRAQVLKFKDGLRGYDPKDTAGLQMRPMAMTLANDEAVDNVVAYIMELKAKSPVEKAEGGDPEKGKALYQVCAACHGDKAQGKKELNAPRLEIQNGWYLSHQLQAFKDGLRGKDPKDATGSQMRPMAMTLSEDGVKDVVAYILTLK